MGQDELVLDEQPEEEGGEEELWDQEAVPEVGRTKMHTNPNPNFNLRAVSKDTDGKLTKDEWLNVLVQANIQNSE